MSTSRGQLWTIANGATAATAGISAMVAGKEMLSGCDMPLAFTGTTLSFTVSDTLGGIYIPLYWEGFLVQFTVAASRALEWHPLYFAGRRFVKAVSGSAEGAARAIIPRFREYR